MTRCLRYICVGYTCDAYMHACRYIGFSLFSEVFFVKRWEHKLKPCAILCYFVLFCTTRCVRCTCVDLFCWFFLMCSFVGFFSFAFLLGSFDVEHVLKICAILHEQVRSLHVCATLLLVGLHTHTCVCRS